MTRSASNVVRPLSYSRPHQAGTITPTSASRASRGSASSKPSILGVERALSRSGRLNVSVATPSEISWIRCFSNWMLLPKANQQPRCGRSVSGGRGAGLVGARVAQGPYDVARRASRAPLSWASTNSARRPQTNAHLTLLPFELIVKRALSRSGRLNVSVATPSGLSSISCFSIWMLLPKTNQQPRCGRTVSGGRGAGLVGARVAQGPYDVARRARHARHLAGRAQTLQDARKPRHTDPCTI